jgi:hypothetical protein
LNQNTFYPGFCQPGASAAENGRRERGVFPRACPPGFFRPSRFFNSPRPQIFANAELTANVGLNRACGTVEQIVMIFFAVVPSTANEQK